MKWPVTLDATFVVRVNTIHLEICSLQELVYPYINVANVVLWVPRLLPGANGRSMDEPCEELLFRSLRLTISIEARI